MPPVFWLDVVALGISAVIATSLVLITLGAGIKRQANRCFLLFVLMEALWASCSLLWRLGLWLERGNPLFLSELGALAVALMGPLLFLFVSRHLDRRTLLTDLIGSVGLAAMGLVAIPLFRHQLALGPQLNANGSATTGISNWGVVVVLLPMLYMAWSLVLFWQQRRRIEEPRLALSIAFLLVGFFVGSVVEVRLPLISVTNTISLAILGYVVISQQLFNPLRAKTAALQESEIRYRTLFENANDAIFTMKDGRFVDCNPKTLEMFGCTREEIIGRSPVHFSPPTQPDGRDSKDVANEKIASALNGKPQRFDWRHIRHDGTPFDAEVSLSRFELSGETLLQAVVRDITSRKRAEGALQESEKKYRNIIESTPIGMHMYQLEPDGRLVFIGANPAADEILGVDNSQFVGKTIEEAFPALTETEVPERYRLAAAEGTTWHTSQIVYEENQITGAFEVHAFQTSPGRMVATFLDITERARSEEALRRERDLVARITETSPLGIVVVDHSGQIAFANPRAEQVLGLAKDEIAQRSYNAPQWRITAYEGSPFPDEQLPFARVMATGRPVFDVRHAIEWPDGRRVLLSIHAAPLVDESGRVDGMVAMIEDITARIQAEGELAQYRDHLEELVEERTTELGQEIAERVRAEKRVTAALAEKEVLLREIHHRVKNNLQALIHLIDMQAEAIDDPQVLEMLGALQGRARTMALVHEKLYQAEDLARIEFRPYLEDLTAHLFHVLRGNRPVGLRIDAEDARIDVNLAIPCGLIVNELVTNALKHAFPEGAGGEPEIRVAFAAHEGEYELTVSDNGVGLLLGLDGHGPESLGLQLVNIWATHQLRGSLDVNTERGTLFKVTFADRGKGSEFNG